MVAAGQSTLVPAGVILSHHWTKLMLALPEQFRQAGLAQLNDIMQASGMLNGFQLSWTRLYLSLQDKQALKWL